MLKYIIFLVLIFAIINTNAKSDSKVNANLSNEINKLLKETKKIPKERKQTIEEMAKYIAKKLNSDNEVNLTFICTHNSRRSHISQLWAFAISNYFGISNINCFSGGTEATAFNHRSVKALKKCGFDIEQTEEGSNPKYKCRIGDGLPELISFSKKYDDPSNPQKNFIAVMVCSDADHNCPYIPTADNRFSLNYEDPKRYDNTLKEETEYDKTVNLIGREIAYLIKLVKENLKK